MKKAKLLALGALAALACMAVATASAATALFTSQIPIGDLSLGLAIASICAICAMVMRFGTSHENSLTTQRAHSQITAGSTHNPLGKFSTTTLTSDDTGFSLNEVTTDLSPKHRNDRNAQTKLLVMAC
jgi:hypothetical protein